MNLWGIKDKKNGLWANVWVSKGSAQMVVKSYPYLSFPNPRHPKIEVVRVTLKEVKARKKQGKKA